MTKSRPTVATAAPPEEVLSLGYLLREAYAHLQQQVYANVAAAGFQGLRPTHSPILRSLPVTGGRVADLARSTGMAKQSVSYIVEDLIELGYLQSEPDPDDGRARRLAYTEQGKRLLAALLRASAEAEAQLAARISPTGLQSLRVTLTKLLHDS